jgi:hypothetical protein
MMTIEQAKQAVELSDERKSLINRANKIRMTDAIHFGAELKPVWPKRETVTFEVEKFADEFRALLTKELKAQVAQIDKELRALGVEPDPFDAAAPVKTEGAA